jgi:hypothetical protein
LNGAVNVGSGTSTVNIGTATALVKLNNATTPTYGYAGSFGTPSGTIGTIVQGVATTVAYFVTNVELNVFNITLPAGVWMLGMCGGYKLISAVAISQGYACMFHPIAGVVAMNGFSGNVPGTGSTPIPLNSVYYLGCSGVCVCIGTTNTNIAVNMCFTMNTANKIQSSFTAQVYCTATRIA